MELKEYHYTYYSYEEYGRGYIGSRTYKCLPEKDVKYFGSYKDKTFKPTQKIILKDDYLTREDAYADEIILREHYKVVENIHFANRAYQTSTRFTTKGLEVKWSDESKRKLSESIKGKPRKPMSEETKRKISKSTKGKKKPSMSEEAKIKISKFRKGKSPWNKGKRMDGNREWILSGT